MTAKLLFIIDKTTQKTFFLRFFIKKLHFFLAITKKVVPLHPQN